MQSEREPPYWRTPGALLWLSWPPRLPELEPTEVGPLLLVAGGSLSAWDQKGGGLTGRWRR